MIRQKDFDRHTDKVAELQVLLARCEDICEIMEEEDLGIVDWHEVRRHIIRAQETAEADCF